jgi:ABC-type uncharacterized transport system ATPase subunit
VPPEVRRRIAFELALTHPNPALFVLFEPLSLPDLDRERALAAIRAGAERGATVIVMTASVRDAADIGGDVILLDRGRFVRRPGEPLSRELAPGRPFVLEVTSPDAKKLASLLALESAVTGIEWGQEKSSEQVRVRGGDANALALTVARVARAAKSSIQSIRAPLPGLDEIRAASAGLWRAAQEAAREAATQARQAQLPKQDIQAPPAEPPPVETKPPEPGAAT